VGSSSSEPEEKKQMERKFCAVVLLEELVATNKFHD